VSQNVIELNGKRYDAITGAYLGKSHVLPKHITDHYTHGKVIDGFVRPVRPAPPKPKAVDNPPELASSSRPTPVKSAAYTAAHGPVHAHHKAPHATAHQPERAKTLMRRATVKPEYSLKPAIKTQAPAEVMARPASAIAHKRSAYSVDPTRNERAVSTVKHQAVRHFHHGAAHPAAQPVAVRVQAVAVRPAPAHAVGHRPGTDIFEKAIARADSHNQPAHKVHRVKSRRHRLVNTLAIAAAFLIITGFVTYLNLPQLQLRVASMQAGFGASMPGYLPTGYALDGGINHAGGTISLTFKSGDSRFRLTQQSSDWNSQTLLDNTLALDGQHQTVQKNGQTIYIYGQSTSAAWVNGGVRYDLSGNAQLSPDEITSIATSL
jgi:hypothetical protein